MKCEEFEAIGLERSGLRMSELDVALRQSAAEHAARCASCAALQESWQEARIALQALRETTRDVETPQRVEMRLLHEFGMRHRTCGLGPGDGCVGVRGRELVELEADANARQRFRRKCCEAEYLSSVSKSIVG